jgi:glycosyltransferase involved in cell wall biosynthesis
MSRIHFRRLAPDKILEIGNYPPPVCGWSIQTKLLVEEIRRRGVICDVLNLNENRTKQSSEYVSVQSGFDYLLKLVRFAARGYHFQVHVNGQSEKGYVLALVAAIIGRLARQPVTLSWRGGLQQKYFPRPRFGCARLLYAVLFLLAGRISCNNSTVKTAIEQYGVSSHRVTAIPGFSVQHLGFERVQLKPETDKFLDSHCPVFFCYVSFRPEYKLCTLRQAMFSFQQRYPNAGFIWLGFPTKELPAAESFVASWPQEERRSVLLLSNVPHDEFLTLLIRSTAYIRTPACDGVSASVLEALSLGIPVVASQNGQRPLNVLTYEADSHEDLCAKLFYLSERYSEIKERTFFDAADDNIVRTADWLLEASKPASSATNPGLAHAQ